MRVLVSGYYGFENIGDELILSQIITDIKSVINDAEIVVCSANKEYTRTIHGIDSVDRFTPEAVINAIKESDVVVVGGGGLIQEYEDIDISALFRNFGYNVSSYSIAPLIAKVFRKPVFYWGHGIGPIFTRQGREFVRWFYELADFTTLRDIRSYDLLKRIYPEIRDVRVDTDPVMGLDINRFISRLDFDIPGDRIKIGINLRPWFGIGGVIEKIARAFNALYAEARNFTIVPIPFDLILDEKILKEFGDYLLEGCFVCYPFHRSDAPSRVVTLMSRLDLFVGMRLHSTMLSKRLGIPTVCLSYDEKTEIFADILQMPVLRVAELTENNFLSEIKPLMGIDRYGNEKCEYQYETPSFFRVFAESVRKNGQFSLNRMEEDASGSGREHIFQKNEFLTYENTIKVLKAELNELRSRLNEFEEIERTLNDVYMGNFWKVANRYYTIRDRINVIGKIQKVLNFLKNEGMARLMQKSLSTFINKVKGFGNKDVQKKLLIDLLSSHKGNEENILVYPPTVDWNIPLFQRPQHLALQFSKLGYLFFFCSPNGSYDNVNGLERVADNLYLTNNYHMLIKNISRGWIIVNSTNQTVTVDNIRAWKARGFKIIYDYIDKIDPLITGSVDKIIQRFRALRDDDVDLIMASATKLYREMTERFSKEKVLYIPNAVEYDHFHIKKRVGDCPQEMERIACIGKPIIGYYGALAKWIDFKLIDAVAVNRPDWNVVLIGHDYDGSVKAISSRKNIKLLGPKSYKELPQYAIWFDVAIIPFQAGEIAKTTSPLKLFEYMAMNKPVIATKDLVECYKYNGIFIAKDEKEFIEKIEEGLTLKDDPEYMRLLDSQAKENTWEQRARDISGYLSAYQQKKRG